MTLPQRVSGIRERENVEPRLSLALRVVVALNVPLILWPLLGFDARQAVFTAFGAFMVALFDYRGRVSARALMQLVQSLFMAALVFTGILLGHSVFLSVSGMLVVGLVIALMRNLRDYGASIGIAGGFFYLLGIAEPAGPQVAFSAALHTLSGGVWAMTVTLAVNALTPVHPLRAALARIWMANRDLLAAILDNPSAVTGKEAAVRTAVELSHTHFPRHAAKFASTEKLMDGRRAASLFTAGLHTMSAALQLLREKADARVIAQAENAAVALLETLQHVNAAVLGGDDAPLDLLSVRIRRVEGALQVLGSVNAGKASAAFQQFTSGFRHCVAELRQLPPLIAGSNGQAHESRGAALFQEFIGSFKGPGLQSFIRSLYTYDRHELRYALRVAICLAISVAVYKVFDLDHGYWMALTVLIVIQPHFGATRRKGVERLGGTVAGIVAGSLLLFVQLPKGAVVVLLAVISFLVAYNIRRRYSVGVFFSTVMMVVLLQLSHRVEWDLMLLRVLSTFAGAVLALLAGIVVFPVWEKHRFAELFEGGVASVRDYALEVLRGAATTQRWYGCRRNAEVAVNRVLESAERMAQEPARFGATAGDHLVAAGSLLRLARHTTATALLLRDDGGAALDPAAEKLGTLLDAVVRGRPHSAAANGLVGEQLAPPLRDSIQRMFFEAETLASLAARLR